VGNRLAVSAKAGVAYAVTVFAIGFVLGTARILLLAPRLGATKAVSIKRPSFSRRAGTYRAIG